MSNSLYRSTRSPVVALSKAYIRRVKNAIASLPRYFSSADVGVPVHLVRNFGISAHVDSGKTTLTERILYYTGRINKIHEVNGSDGVGAKMDSMELERERGITIQSAATFTKWDFNKQRYHFNIIDTPGHVDFQIEVERAMRVLDGAVLVICGVAGVQPQTFSVEKQMKRYAVPRIAFINKLDKAGADEELALQSVQTKLGNQFVPIQVSMRPSYSSLTGLIDVIENKAYEYVGDSGEEKREIEIPSEFVDKVQETRLKLIESLADVDDSFGDTYLEGVSQCTPHLIHSALRRATISRTLVPVLFGSAKGNKGVQDVLDSVCKYLPHAGETIVEGFKKSDPTVTIPVTIDPKKRLIAMAFKIQDVERYGTLTYVKVYQGSIKKGVSIIDAQTDNKVQWKKMYRLHSNEVEEIKVAEAGDIVAISGAEVKSGTTLIDDSLDISLSSMYVPSTVISMAAKVAKGSDPQLFTKAYKRFQREDPTFTVHVDEESKEYIMSGMGELHLDIYTERMKREYGITILLGNPKVNLRESVSTRHKFEYCHKRQSGGRGEWAKIEGFIEPIDPTFHTLPESEFINDQSGNAVPPHYVTALRKAFAKITKQGPLTGYPILNLRFVLVDGETHSVDSSDVAFSNCLFKAFQSLYLPKCQAALAAVFSLDQTEERLVFGEHYKHAGPVVMEPVVELEVEGPDECAQSIRRMLTDRQIFMSESQHVNGNFCVKGETPLRLTFGFIGDLRKATRGLGEFKTDFKYFQGLKGTALDEAMKTYQMFKEKEDLAAM